MAENYIEEVHPHDWLPWFWYENKPSSCPKRNSETFSLQEVTKEAMNW